MLKKLTRGFLNLLLISTLTTFIAATTSVLLFTPAHLKQWVQKSDTYQTISSTIINQSFAEQTQSISSISLSNPIIMGAAKSSLTTDFIQKSTEQIIDSTFVWLSGETPNPTFSIDLLPVKKSFADKIVIAVKDRYNQLPLCKPGIFPKSTDPLTIECRPVYGVDINKAAEDLRVEILQNKEFLPESAITSANLAGNDEKSSIFNSKAGPQAYQYLQLSPYVLSGLLVLFVTGIILLNDSKRKGFKRVGALFVLSGILAMISVWLASLGYGKYQNWLPITTPGMINDIISPIIDAFRKDAISYTLIISGVVSGLGILIVVLAVITKKRTKQNTKTDKPTSKDSADADRESSLPPESVTNVRSAKTTTNSQSNNNDGSPSTAPEVRPEISKKLIQ